MYWSTYHHLDVSRSFRNLKHAFKSFPENITTGKQNRAKAKANEYMT